MYSDCKNTCPIHHSFGAPRIQRRGRLTASSSALLDDEKKPSDEEQRTSKANNQLQIDKRKRGKGKKIECRFEGCANERFKKSACFCNNHTSIYIAGNFEIFGTPTEMLAQHSKRQDIREMWAQVEKRLAQQGMLGKVEDVKEEVYKHEKYYMRVVESWDGRKKSDVELLLLSFVQHWLQHKRTHIYNRVCDGVYARTLNISNNIINNKLGTSSTTSSYVMIWASTSYRALD